MDPRQLQMQLQGEPVELFEPESGTMSQFYYKQQHVMHARHQFMQGDHTEEDDTNLM